MHVSNFDADTIEEISVAAIDHLRNIGIKHRIKKHAASAIKHSQQTPKCGALFRRPLQEIECVNTVLSGEHVKVPHFVVDACASISQNLGTEGIFRKGGSAARQKQIKVHLDEGNQLGLGFHEIDVANILKLFLRELPEPLLPSSFQEILLRCLLLKDKKVEGLLFTCLILPPSNLNTLAYLMAFFAEVASHSNLNKMDSRNLAIIIAPSIMPLEQGKMTAASSTRLNHHAEVIELLIEHADKIGVLPESLLKFVRASNAGSFSTSNSEALHKSASELSRSSKKKRSRRSGSLTRMFNGFKKMVGNKAATGSEMLVDGNDASELAPEPSTSACIKSGTKRKAALGTSAFSFRNKRDVLKMLPEMQTLASTPTVSSWASDNLDLRTFTPSVCQHPNPRKTNSPPMKSKSKRLFTAKHDRSDNDQEIVVEKRSRLSLRGRKGAKKQENNDELHCPEMSYASNYSGNLPALERRWSSSIFGRKKRLVDVHMLEPAIELPAVRRSNDADPESAVAAFSWSSSNLALEGVNLSSQNISDTSEDYVRIPKKEYEEIKNRVSAIEEKISEVYNINNISMASSSNASPGDDGTHAEKVQTAYEKTLEESTTFDNTSSSTDNLAKRLGRDLKIRQSISNKVIRSPSARRIGTLRRRSRESAQSFRKNSPAMRNSTLVRNMSEIIMSRPESQLYPRSGLKRGGPNTVWSGLPQPDPIDAFRSTTPKENARIQLCFHNEHGSGTQKAEGGNKDAGLSNGESPSFRALAGSPLTRSMAQRASASQETGQSSDSMFSTRVHEKASQGHAVPDRRGSKEWQDAQGFFKANPTPAQIAFTGRASIRKILELNAGMVSQKMEIFNSNVSGVEQALPQLKRRSLDRPRETDSPIKQFKRVMSALQIGQNNRSPASFTATKMDLQKFDAKTSVQARPSPISSVGGRSASPKKIGSPRKLKGKCIQRKKSIPMNPFSSKSGGIVRSPPKSITSQKSGLISSAANPKLTKSSNSKVASSLPAPSWLGDSKENAIAASNKTQQSPFRKPQSPISFSPQMSLPENLKEAIYSVCTPEIDKLVKRRLSASPLKECNRTCAKTPRETPFIKQPLLTITPLHFGKTPQKMAADRSARKMTTPMRAIMTDSLETPLGLPRRQSPRLLAKARVLVKTP